jgi:hypothetical protein
VSLACEIDPLSPFILGNASLILAAIDRLGEAKNLADRVLAVDAGHMIAINARCKVFGLLGQHSEAIAMGERLVSPARTPIYVGVLGGIYGRAGRIDDATRLLRELEDRARQGECVPAYAFLDYWLGQRNVEEFARRFRRCKRTARRRSSIWFNCECATSVTAKKWHRERYLGIEVDDAPEMAEQTDV